MSEAVVIPHPRPFKRSRRRRPVAGRPGAEIVAFPVPKPVPEEYQCTLNDVVRMWPTMGRTIKRMISIMLESEATS